MTPKRLRQRIGVEGSLHRRVLYLCESLGLELLSARDLHHPSRMVLVFQNDKCLTEITLEDLEDPKVPKGTRA